MKKILFTTDFDKDAPAMLVYTAQFAQAIGASITLFHAYGTGQLLSEKETTILGEKHLAALHQLVDDHLPEKFKNLSLEYMVDEDYAFDAIPKVAADESVSAVALGIKNTQNSFLELIGGITLEAILDVDCHVLVIPDFFETNQIDRLGSTTEFKFRDIALLNQLRKFGKKIGKQAEIYCLHVFDEQSPTLARAEKDMETLYSVFDGRKGTKIHFEMQSGKLVKTIKDFAKGKQLDLLVMNSYQRDFISKIFDKSLSREVAMEIRVPLLIMKD